MVRSLGFQPKNSGSNPGRATFFGVLAQLARASALHAEGHRFESDRLHMITCLHRSMDRLSDFGSDDLRSNRSGGTKT